MREWFGGTVAVLRNRMFGVSDMRTLKFSWNTEERSRRYMEPRSMQCGDWLHRWWTFQTHLLEPQPGNNRSTGGCRSEYTWHVSFHCCDKVPEHKTWGRKGLFCLTV
jgi:hypothetical protein